MHIEIKFVGVGMAEIVKPLDFDFGPIDFRGFAPAFNNRFHRAFYSREEKSRATSK
jgi:hypothetical protein